MSSNQIQIPNLQQHINGVHQDQALPLDDSAVLNAVRTLAAQTRANSHTLSTLVNHPIWAPFMYPYAQLQSHHIIQMLKWTLVGPLGNQEQFAHRLEHCSDEIRANAREIAGFALSLDNRSFAAANVASCLLERGPRGLIVHTQAGARSFSQPDLETLMLHSVTQDNAVLAGMQAEDNADLQQLYAEWSGPEGIDPYPLPGR
ncbi:MAG TPA: hypothetical protein VFV43_03775 [Limnobacter sp.]|nr:hypothetical protein [Limnobacter sp.]